MGEQKRDLDGSNLKYHPERVAEWRKEGDCFPIYAEIGPTNRCNHRCIFCALDFLEHKGVDIDKEVMVSALEDMASHGVKSVMFAGEGEPLLHEDIGIFARRARESGLTVVMTTNGALLDEEKAESILPYLTWIRFSIDAGKKETHSQVHQTREEDFEKVMKNLKYAAEVKRRDNLKVDIGAQFLLIPQNAGEVLEFVKSVRDTGADNAQIKPYSQHPQSQNKFSINYRQYAHLAPEVDKLNTETFKAIFRERTIQRRDEKPRYDFCRGLSFFALIDCRGSVIPCNLFYGNSEFTYGNLYEQSFLDIWKSGKRKEVLGKIRNERLERCREICRLDAVNQDLYDLTNALECRNVI